MLAKQGDDKGRRGDGRENNTDCSGILALQHEESNMIEK